MYIDHMIFYSMPILIQHVMLRFALQPSSLPPLSFYPDDIGGIVWPLLLRRALEIDITSFIDYRSHRTHRAIFYKESIRKDIIKKEYIFHIVALDQQCIITRPHAYLSNTKHEYLTCFICKARKSMVCIKCGSCFLCHPFTERIETTKPVFYTGIAMLCDIESPALSEIKR
jgi:hypothetical protein